MKEYLISESTMPSLSQPISASFRCRAKLPLILLSRLPSSMASKALRKLIPLFDRVLVERFAPETKTKSGIILPEKAQGKVHMATVIAVGPGMRDRDGKLVSVQLKEGDRVLLPEYGGTKVQLEDKEAFLFKENDILAKFVE